MTLSTWSSASASTCAASTYAACQRPPPALVDGVASCRHCIIFPVLPPGQVYNKVDQISLEEMDRLARQPHSIVMRCGRPYRFALTEAIPSTDDASICRPGPGVLAAAVASGAGTWTTLSSRCGRTSACSRSTPSGEEVRCRRARPWRVARTSLSRRRLALTWGARPQPHRIFRMRSSCGATARWRTWCVLRRGCVECGDPRN